MSYLPSFLPCVGEIFTLLQLLKETRLYFSRRREMRTPKSHGARQRTLAPLATLCNHVFDGLEFKSEKGGISAGARKKNALMLTQLRCSLRASSASLLVSVSVSFLKSLLSLLCPGWCQAKTEEKVWITPPMLRLALPSAKRLPFSCLFCLPLPPFFCMCGGVKRL